jgi:D-aminopeptidase
VSNYGARRDLHMLTGPTDEPGAARGPAGAAPEPVAPLEPAGDGGSIVIVLGTDAPLSERQLRRLAGRAALGLGRAGSFAANASGEFAIAFSTAQRIPHRSDGSHQQLRFLRDDSTTMRQLFEAAGELVHESVLGSLCCADATPGRDGHVAQAFPYELLEGAPAVRAPAAGRR